MREYELMVILDPDLDERAVAPTLDKFLKVVKDDGGTIDKVDIWGKRRLAYDIKKRSEGIYAVVMMTTRPETAKELDRQLGLAEVVLRTKLLRPEPKPAPRAAKAPKAKSAPAAAPAAATPAPPAAAPPAPATPAAPVTPAVRAPRIPAPMAPKPVR